MNTGQQKEFVKQVNENQRIIHKICKIYTDNPHDHEDLFQEITIQLWKSYPSFRGEAKFSSWMYRIGLNTALALFRKRDKQVSICQETSVENLKIIQDEHHEDERLKLMYDAIHQLSDVEKALIMMFLDDKPYKEIAEILGITEGNARVKMNRAKEKLKTLIKK